MAAPDWVASSVTAADESPRGPFSQSPENAVCDHVRPMTERILVATLETSTDTEALRWAADEAVRRSAELLVLRVLEPVGSDGAGNHKPLADEELTRKAQHLAGAGARGLTVTAMDAAEAIVHV